jgi:HK97 gp10 family phage protein
MRVNYVANRGSNKLEGVAELKAALAELSNEVATKEGRNANRAAAGVIQKAFKEYAPYRPGVQLKYWKTKGGSKSRDYGDLRDNIRVRLAKARKENTITYNVTTGNAFWGYFLEYGTVNMPAQPWMRPAFDAFVGRATQVQIDRLKVGVERAAKKANKARNGGMLSNGRSR